MRICAQIGQEKKVPKSEIVPLSYSFLCYYCCSRYLVLCSLFFWSLDPIYIYFFFFRSLFSGLFVFFFLLNTAFFVLLIGLFLSFISFAFDEGIHRRVVVSALTGVWWWEGGRQVGEWRGARKNIPLSHKVWVEWVQQKERKKSEQIWRKSDYRAQNISSATSTSSALRETKKKWWERGEENNGKKRERKRWAPTYAKRKMNGLTCKVDTNTNLNEYQLLPYIINSPLWSKSQHQQREKERKKKLKERRKTLRMDYNYYHNQEEKQANMSSVGTATSTEIHTNIFF